MDAKVISRLVGETGTWKPRATKKAATKYPIAAVAKPNKNKKPEPTKTAKPTKEEIAQAKKVKLALE